VRDSVSGAFAGDAAGAGEPPRFAGRAGAFFFHRDGKRSSGAMNFAALRLQQSQQPCPDCPYVDRRQGKRRQPVPSFFGFSIERFDFK
jgi:hypothetical protein